MAKTKKQWAAEALQVQDACNPSGVAHALSCYFTHACDGRWHNGTQEKCDDPIVRLFVSKMSSLTGMSHDDNFGPAYRACQELAKS